MIHATRSLAIAVACMFVALPVASAGATPPTVEVMPFDEIEVVAPGERLVFGTNPCPFTITIHHQGTFVATTFFDQDGTPIRQLIRSKDFTETYSANGLSLTTKSPGSALITIDPTTGEIIITVRGNSRHLIVPGIGPVLATAGHFLIDGNGNLIDISGLNIPAGSEFCAALSN
jgi:hypothetical protein